MSPLGSTPTSPPGGRDDIVTLIVDGLMDVAARSEEQRRQQYARLRDQAGGRVSEADARAVEQRLAAEDIPADIRQEFRAALKVLSARPLFPEPDEAAPMPEDDEALSSQAPRPARTDGDDPPARGATAAVAERRQVREELLRLALMPSTLATLGRMAGGTDVDLSTELARAVAVLELVEAASQGSALTLTNQRGGRFRLTLDRHPREDPVAEELRSAAYLQVSTAGRRRVVRSRDETTVYHFEPLPPESLRGTA